MLETDPLCSGETSDSSQRPAEFHGHRFCHTPCHHLETPDVSAALLAGTGMKEHRAARRVDLTGLFYSFKNLTANFSFSSRLLT